MSRKLLFSIILILILIGAITVYYVYKNKTSAFVEINSTSLKISGDLKQEYKIGNLNRLYNKKIQFKGKEINVVDLETVFSYIGLNLENKEDYKIQISDEKNVIETKLTNIKSYYLTENEEDFTLFGSSGNLLIENIENIFIVNTKKDWSSGLNIIDPETNIVNLVPSDFSINNYKIKSFKNNSIAISEGEDIFQEVQYDKKKIINLNDYIDFPQVRTTVINKSGKSVNFKNGFIEVDGNQFNLIDENGALVLEDIKGIILNTPVYNINDVYLDSMHYLKKNEPVMIIIINGLGYYQYVNAYNDGDIPFLQGQTIANRSLTAYRPTTENALKSMFNYENNNLFDQIKAINNSSIYISNTKYIESSNLNYESVRDNNENHYYDDDTFNKISEIINNNDSLIVSNFTDYEKNALAFGPYSDEALTTLRNFDNYISKLSEKWPGNIIITSDHGIHENQAGEGANGSFRFEDMFVPYIIIEK